MHAEVSNLGLHLLRLLLRQLNLLFFFGECIFETTGSLLALLIELFLHLKQCVQLVVTRDHFEKFADLLNRVVAIQTSD